MRSIAAENLEAKMTFLEEQRQRASLINPLIMVIGRFDKKTQNSLKKKKRKWLKMLTALTFVF